MLENVVINDLSTPEGKATLKDYLLRLGEDADVIYTESAPNGSISAKRGKIAIYKNGSTYEQWQNVDGGTTWQRTDPPFPSGVICMWSGTIATIPTGWVLCDGANSTPDLRDRFIVGAKQDDGGVAKTNVTGALTQSGDGTAPAHTHTGPSHQHGATGLGTSDPGTHAHGTTYAKNAGSVEFSSGGSGSVGATAVIPGDGAHTHTITGSVDAGGTGATGSTGTGTTNIAIYYALAFIMKS